MFNLWDYYEFVILFIVNGMTLFTKVFLGPSVLYEPVTVSILISLCWCQSTARPVDECSRLPESHQHQRQGMISGWKSRRTRMHHAWPRWIWLSFWSWWLLCDSYHLNHRRQTRCRHRPDFVLSFTSGIECGICNIGCPADSASYCGFGQRRSAGIVLDNCALLLRLVRVKKNSLRSQIFNSTRKYRFEHLSSLFFS